MSEEEEIDVTFEGETFLNTGEKPEALRYQGTLTVLMTFFPIELLYSVMISSETMQR